VRTPRAGTQLRVGVVLAAALVAGCGVGHVTSRPLRDDSARRAAPDPLVRRRVVIGQSVRGRPITAVELGDPDEPRRALVVGVIHGDETAGRAITRRLEQGPLPRALALWIVDELNPDGVARRTRQNADGVDLNRNFPWQWRPLGRPGDPQYSGTGPLSEPESRAAHQLIVSLRPSITIWFHQPLGVTDLSGGDARIERRFARLSGLPARRLTRYPGSAAGWQDHALPYSTAFVVELPQGRPTASAAAHYASAVLGVAAA
jgi:protein MpaA